MKGKEQTVIKATQAILRKNVYKNKLEKMTLEQKIYYKPPGWTSGGGGALPSPLGAP